VRTQRLTILGTALLFFAPTSQAASTIVKTGDYRNFTCQQLFEAAQQASAHADELFGGVGQSKATAVASTEDTIEVPKIIFPAKPVSGELSLAKQRLQAIEDASIQGECPIVFRGQ
jgi:hypothetical protein